jgi:hypothetical protein
MKLLLVPDIYQIHPRGLDRFNDTKDLGELRIAEVLHAIEAGGFPPSPGWHRKHCRSGADAGGGNARVRAPTDPIPTDPVAVTLYPFRNRLARGPRDGATGQPRVRMGVWALAPSRHGPCSPAEPCARPRVRGRPINAASPSRPCCTGPSRHISRRSSRGRPRRTGQAAGRGSSGASLRRTSGAGSSITGCRACGVSAAGTRRGGLQLPRPRLLSVLRRPAHE